MMGRKVEELAPNLRSFPVGNYLIFYRINADAIDVIHILHGAMNYERLLFPED